MKITFEGDMLADIIRQMVNMLADTSRNRPTPVPTVQAQDPGPVPVQKVNVPKVDVPVDKPVDKPVEKPKRARTEKQLANDEKLRTAALEKIAARKAAKAAPAVEKFVEKPVQDAPEAQPFAEPEIDPAEMVKLRQQTIEELQAAYANGHQQEVFELLSRFGNGAKSFRELPPESFVPIRKAIDNGALT